MFYLFDQVNSGGFFCLDDKVTQYVIIESDSADNANDRAESIGIYFDGTDDGKDCECCGNRWSRVLNDDATSSPQVYDSPPENFSPWLIAEGEVYCRVYFLDGTVKEYIVPEDNNERLTAQIEKAINSYQVLN